DVTFLVEEMKAVFDPRGGYFKAGGVYMPSLVAELGSIVEEHLKSIGLIQDPELSPEQRALIEEKRAAYAALDSNKNPDEPDDLPRVLRAPGARAGVAADGAGAGGQRQQRPAKAQVAVGKHVQRDNGGLRKVGLEHVVLV